jgi:hypothetical protein
MTAMAFSSWSSTFEMSGVRHDLKEMLVSQLEEKLENMELVKLGGSAISHNPGA